MLCIRLYALWTIILVASLSDASSVRWSRKGLGGLAKFVAPQRGENIVVASTQQGVLAGVNSVNGLYVWRSLPGEKSSYLVSLKRSYSFVGAITFSKVNMKSKAMHKEAHYTNVLVRILQQMTGKLLWARTFSIKTSQLFRHNHDGLFRTDLAFLPPSSTYPDHLVSLLEKDRILIAKFSDTASIELQNLDVSNLLKPFPELHHVPVSIIRLGNVESHLAVLAKIDEQESFDWLIFLVNPSSGTPFLVRRMRLTTPFNLTISYLEFRAEKPVCYIRGPQGSYLMDLGFEWVTELPLTGYRETELTIKPILVEPKSIISNDFLIRQPSQDTLEIFHSKTQEKFHFHMDLPSQLVDAVVVQSDSYRGLLSFSNLMVMGVLFHNKQVSVLWINEEALSRVSQVIQYNSRPFRYKNPLPARLSPLRFLKTFSLKKLLAKSITLLFNVIPKPRLKDLNSASPVEGALIVASPAGCVVHMLNPTNGSSLWKHPCPSFYSAATANRHKNAAINSLREEENMSYFRYLETLNTSNSAVTYPQIVLVNNSVLHDTNGLLDRVLVILWPCFTVSWISPRTGQNVASPIKISGSPFSIRQGKIVPSTISNGAVFFIDVLNHNATHLEPHPIDQQVKQTEIFTFSISGPSSITGRVILPTQQSITGRSTSRKLWRFDTASLDQTIHEFVESIYSSHTFQNTASLNTVRLKKYSTENHILLSTIEQPTGNTFLYLLNVHNGNVVMSRRLGPSALPPCHMLLQGHRAMVFYRNSSSLRYECLSLEFYQHPFLNSSSSSLHHSALHTILSKTPLAFYSRKASKLDFDEPKVFEIPTPKVFSRTFILGFSLPEISAFSESRYGVTPQLFVYVDSAGHLVSFPQSLISAMRPYPVHFKDPESSLIEILTDQPVQSYSAFLSPTPKDFLSENSSILWPDGILTYSGRLESVSNVFVYGLDLFAITVYPALAFDFFPHNYSIYFVPILMLGGSTLVFYLRKKAIALENRFQWI